LNKTLSIKENRSPRTQRRNLRADGCLERIRPAEAGRLYFSFYWLRVAVALLIVRLLGIFVALAGSLALLAGVLTAALLLAGFLTRCLVLLAGFLTRRLILLAGLVLVRHVISFHGNASTTARGSGSFLTKKKSGSHCRHDATVGLTYSGLRFLIHCFSSAIAPR
jgi:hypothetical protein